MKIALPTNPATLWLYCLGQPAPNHPDFMSICLLLAHTTLFQELLVAFTKWAEQQQVTLTLNPIQEEQTEEIGWLVYSTKHTNCQELGAAITMAIQTPAVLQFKQITMGHPKGTKAHTAHIMVGATQATKATLQLEGIYGEASLNNKSTQYPLGQCLLLGPLVATLNETNLGQLNLLLKRQASFCQELVTLFTQDIASMASLT